MSRFRQHFVVYFALCVAFGVGRIFQGRMHWEFGHMAAILVWSVPLAAAAAWFASRQPLYVDGQPVPRPRIFKAVAVGLGICAAAIGAGWLLR